MNIPCTSFVAPFLIGTLILSVRFLPVTRSRQRLPTRREIAALLWSVPVAYFIAQAIFSNVVSIAASGFLAAVFVPGYMGVLAGRRVFLWSGVTVAFIWFGAWFRVY